MPKEPDGLEGLRQGASDSRQREQRANSGASYDFLRVVYSSGDRIVQRPWTLHYRLLFRGDASTVPSEV